ncbi:hypothetical protein EDF42_3193 [Curtobacterium sp. PhB172]|nr:hypothetical protein EDF42_3193 [Curtobacterium sp. PhB172]
MPSQSASRPRRSAPARCPSRTAHPPRPAPPHPAAASASGRNTRVLPDAARVFRPLALCPRTSACRRPPGWPAASGRNVWVPCNVARVFRPRALCALGATSLEARRQSDGQPPGLQVAIVTAGRASAPPPRPARSPSGRNTWVPPDATRAFRPLALARSGQSAAPPQGLAERLAERAKCPRHPAAQPRHFARSRCAHWTRPAGRRGARPADRNRASRPSPPPPHAPPAPPRPRAGETPVCLATRPGHFARSRVRGTRPRTSRGREPHTGRAPPAHGACARRE